MAKIKDIFAKKILDTQGRYALETTVILNDNTQASSSVGFNIPKGIYEAFDLGGKKENIQDSEVEIEKAIETINTTLKSALAGAEAQEQKKIDRTLVELDATQNKSHFGANVTLSVSQAVAKAAARSSLLPQYLYLRGLLTNQNTKNTLPIPIITIIEGGVHGKDKLIFQDFFAIPASSKNPIEAIAMGTFIYHAVQSQTKNKETNLSALEGGIAIEGLNNQEILNLFKQSIENHYNFSLDVFLGIDAAGDNLFEEGQYRIAEKGLPINQDELLGFYESITTDFGVIYIEDPFSQDDWESWKKVYNALSQKSLIVGDKIVATNPYRLQMALDNNAVSGIIVNPSYIGTVSEAVAVCEMARFKNLKVIVSGNEEDTIDTFFVDFAVGINADYVKLGAPRTNSIARYNRFIEIYRNIGKI
jgi:enolase